MSIRVKKSFAWIWMAALFTATMGVSVHQIYCYCAGMRSVSFFAVEDECSAKKAVAADIPDCCTKKKTTASCCTKGDSNSQKEKSGCTKKTTRFFQLKTEFTLAEKGPVKAFSSPLDIPIPPVFVWIAANSPDPQQVGYQSFPNPPPPLSGRMICVRHGIARC